MYSTAELDPHEKTYLLKRITSVYDQVNRIDSGVSTIVFGVTKSQHDLVEIQNWLMGLKRLLFTKRKIFVADIENLRDLKKCL